MIAYSTIAGKSQTGSRLREQEKNRWGRARATSGRKANAGASRPSASEVHAAMKRALSDLQRAERQAVLVFAEILERKLYRELGYSSIHMYASEALGFSKGKTYQFIRLAESLKELPKLKQSVADGEIPWTKARALSVVATPESEADWISKAKQSSSRELEREIKRARQTTSRPNQTAQGSLLDGERMGPGQEGNREQSGCKPRPGPDVRRRLSLDLSALDGARFEALEEKIRKLARSNELKAASREALVLAAMELLLAAQTGKGQASAECTRVHSTSPYQIVVRRCEECGKSRVMAGGEWRELDPVTFERLACDARVSRPGQRNRASIPPALRQAVLDRDGHRCRMKGCGNTGFLEIHHLEPRHSGGGNQQQNLVTLCSACHQLVHGKRLKLEGLRQLTEEEPR